MQENITDICIVTNDYPAEGHPVNVFVQQLVESFVDLGIKINVVAPQSLTRSLFRGVPIMLNHATYYTSKGNAYEVYRPYTLTFGNGKKVLYKIFEKFNHRNIENILENLNPQTIYGHFWGSAMRAFPYAVKNKKPLFVACGESYDFFDIWIKNLTPSLKENIHKHISGVICVSSENMNKCINNNLCTRENSVVLPNCVNVDLFHSQDASIEKKKLGIKDEDFVIIFVGSFIPRKGPDRVAKAITILNDKHIKAIFIGDIMIGYTYDFDCPGIIFKGPISHEELPLLLNCADVFVLPTRNEGCCNAIVEALACGLPIISSNGAFNDDILDDKNSIRINSDDVDTLTKAIAYLRDNPSKRQQMREASLSRHNIYSIENRAIAILHFMNKNNY